jgi:alpha-glucosidase
MSLPASAQKIIRLTSPGGNIVFALKLSNERIMYSVAQKKTIVDYSYLSLRFQNGNFENNIKFSEPVYRDTTEDYELVVGKTKQVHAHYKEVTIPLEETTAPFRKVNL